MDELRTISKKAYDRLVLALTVLFLVVATLVALVAVKVMGFRAEPWVFCGSAMACQPLARVVADGILRRRGLTRWRTTVEVHARSPFGPVEDVAPGETVEARIPHELILFMLVGMPMMSLILLALAWCVRESWLSWLAIGTAIFFLVCWVENILDYGRPLAWADADGVTGYPSHRALLRRFVPWSDVFRCEVQTVYNTFGKPVLLRPVLKGRHGETLMKLYLMYAPMVEQERIVKAIKTRLPEAEADPWPT
jgi:hypothetical protein